MASLDSKTLDACRFDWDAREELLRRVILERSADHPPSANDDQIIATYFFDFRSQTLSDAGAEISYHATSGIRHPPPGSLLEACTAEIAEIDAWDSTARIGLLQMAFPLKMLLQPDGHLTSCDLLHTVAGAIIFDVYENRDARLVHLEIPGKVLRTFPGPAHGPEGIRRLTNLPPGQPAFGTILKPTAGITPGEVGALVEEIAACPLFIFVKEDENLYPNLAYSPAAERTQRAMAAIRQAKDQREGRGILFAPHISSAPHELRPMVEAVVEAGASAVMLSETFAGGAVRLVREATRHLPTPPAIYGHNAGIGVKTRSIFREVIDLLARLDGIDFRQTAPVRPGRPFLKPYGAEWEASERALAMPIPGIRPATIVRAGALDQGNILLNVADAERRGLVNHILFLAGSAINSIKNRSGKPDPKLGAEAMRQALELHSASELPETVAEEHLTEIYRLAQRKRLTALQEALQQRYPGQLPK